MTRAAINKNGVFIAKPGMQIEQGEAALAFSPIGAQQQILTSGIATLQAFNAGGTQSTAYNRAIVSFGMTFATPPLAYCMLTRTADAMRDIAFAMYLGTRSGDVVREPDLWWETTTTELRIYSAWVLSQSASASYVICRNEAS
ncbi:hypothetical protein BG46_01505 [Brucella anthropi]|uniref:hypothetical protein n=1 Tax=Brucella anthropi TaxID=529 RepID=UPI0004518ADB|nr:hypothetical protein [Brucella anthropi]EXL08579.1 hypothetical protein BG46_01505 [Brucella anthropi]